MKSSQAIIELKILYLFVDDRNKDEIYKKANRKPPPKLPESKKDKDTIYVLFAVHLSDDPTVFGGKNEKGRDIKYAVSKATFKVEQFYYYE